MANAKPIEWEVDDNGCWNCTSHSLGSTGYPRIFFNKKITPISRVYHEKYKGKIPKGHMVRHTCDNPACINPSHLLAGTHQDNVDDKVRRGRQPRGESSGRAKLTESQVREIRKLANPSPTLLGRKYGVSDTTIIDIRKGKIWKHVK